MFNHRFRSLKSKILILKLRGLREGWQRKSFVERSGAKIEANSLTEFKTDDVVTHIVLNEGAPK